MENSPGHPVNAHLSKLFHSIVAASKQNVISSPLSVYICLGMLAEGLSGATFKELKDGLGFGPESNVVDASITGAIAKLSASTNKAAVVKMSNSIYTGHNFPLKAGWVQTLLNKYKATAKSVDFGQAATKQMINDQISEATNGLLKDTVSDIDPATVAMLVNTIYFKGLWAQPFKKEATHKRQFKLKGGTEVSVDFMSHGKLKVPMQQTGPLWYLAIPYEGGKIMFVVEMAANHDNLAPSVPKEVLKIAKLGAFEEVQVYLPKFKFEFKQELKPMLQSLGINKLFTSGQDFHKISDSPVAVSSVLHHAFVIVDEVGTEAAAATVVTMLKSAVLRQPKVFEVNKPFHFHIVDTASQVILFSGTVHQPQFN